MLPWNVPHWRNLWQARAAGRLGHAVLLAGARGVGKEQFALALAGGLLCQAPTDAGGCGICRACAMFAAGSHPDFMRLGCEEDSDTIKVDRIRAVVEFMNLSRHEGVYKVVMIAPAEAMNRAAANGLLKTLEEPPAGAIFLLVAHEPGRLPATVRSRCQRIAMRAPEAMARAWLEDQLGAQAPVDDLLALGNGAPLAALALSGTDAVARRRSLAADLRGLRDGRSTPLEILERWSALGARSVFPVLAGIVHDAVVARVSETPAGVLGDDLRSLSKALSFNELFDIHEKLVEHLETLRGASGLREQSLIEDLVFFLTGISGMRGRVRT
ncbi:MAG: DNA polymerase III subunit delta' [Gammaproteobacteria bacterium]